MPEMTTAGALEVINAIKAVATVARCIDADSLEAFIAGGERFDAFGPLLDPTAWIKDHRRARVWPDGAKALLAFKRETERLASELEGAR